MTSLLSQWMRAHSSRMDPVLIRTLLTRTRFLKYLPASCRSPSEKIWYYLTRVPVLIQWNNQAKIKMISSHIAHPNIPIEQHFQRLHTTSSPVSIKRLQSIIETPGVKKVFLDRKVNTCLHIARPAISVPENIQLENQGENATIAILDTGIAPHPDLDSRILHFVDFVRGKQDPYDDNGHGTHCAGCVASSGKSSNGLYRGIAPKAKLVGIKVLGKYGESNISHVIHGIDWCIQNKDKYNIRIISLSLGSTGEIPYQEDPLCLMAELAWKAGITVVAAAGNAGPLSETITSPGNHPSLITVGATDDQRTIQTQDDQIALFSSRGPTIDGMTKPDILAPGTNITSLRSPTSFLDSWLSTNRVANDYFNLSGTSMSTPIVAGVAALLLTKNPSLTPDEIKACLLQSAATLHHPENAQGKGQIHAQKALGLIMKS